MSQNMPFIFMTRRKKKIHRSVCEVYILLVIIYFSYPEEEQNRIVCKVYDIACFVCVVRFTTSPLLSVLRGLRHRLFLFVLWGLRGRLFCLCCGVYKVASFVCVVRFTKSPLSSVLWGLQSRLFCLCCEVYDIASFVCVVRFTKSLLLSVCPHQAFLILGNKMQQMDHIFQDTLRMESRPSNFRPS